MPLERRPVVVAELVGGLVRQVEVGAAGARAIDVDVQPADLVADADPYRLGQVVTNLVDNAARHARSHGRGAGPPPSGAAGWSSR